MYLVKKASEISGVSVRTLHHYDEIGLLSPKKGQNGYRYYSEEDMATLQTILFYRYLGFSLKKIKELLLTGDNDRLPHLKKQLYLMKNEKIKLLTLIDTLEKTIESQERKKIMSTKEKFKGFTYQDNLNYTQSAIDQYGRDVIEKAAEKQKGREEEVAEGFNRIFFSFSKNLRKGLKSTSEENIKLSEELHNHLCKYAFDCSYQVFSSIGYGYIKNGEFKKNLEKFGEGTAQYICDAIQQYVKVYL